MPNAPNKKNISSFYLTSKEEYLFHERGSYISREKGHVLLTRISRKKIWF